MKKDSIIISMVVALYFACRYAFAGTIGLASALLIPLGVFVLLMLNSFFATPAKAFTPREGFDWGMHYFRGFAIVNIVIVHYLSSAGCDGLKNALFQNATVYFLFISGYLCQYLDLKKHKPNLDYYKAKMTNVLSPYVVWSLIFFLLALVDSQPHEGSAWLSHGKNPLAFIGYVLTGRVSFQFWYIPFVTVLFLVSPLLLKLKNDKLIATTVVACVLFLVFPDRPIGFSLRPMTFLNLYCHFTFFYLLGFVYARYKGAIDRVTSQYLGLIIALVILVTILIVKPEAFGVPTIAVESLQSSQKMLISLLVIQGFDLIRNKRIFVLDALAQYSFTIYFLHYYFLTECLSVRQALAKFVGGGAADVIVIPLYILALLLFAHVLKKALGSRSRMVIGA